MLSLSHQEATAMEDKRGINNFHLVRDGKARINHGQAFLFQFRAVAFKNLNVSDGYEKSTVDSSSVIQK